MSELAAEVIVADCGSGDDTRAVALGHGARVSEGAPMRARACNRAAAEAGGEMIIFLHADTLLPDRAAERVEASGADFGGFRLRFAERDVRLRVAEMMINLRTTLTRCPWGDQAQFVRREAFLRDGGFREIAIMDDYELAVRMKRRGRVALLPQTVTTSGRRFLEKGLLRTAAINWRIILAWRFGADAEALARLYRR